MMIYTKIPVPTKKMVESTNNNLIIVTSTSMYSAIPDDTPAITFSCSFLNNLLSIIYFLLYFKTVSASSLSHQHLRHCLNLKWCIWYWQYLLVVQNDQLGFLFPPMMRLM